MNNDQNDPDARQKRPAARLAQTIDAMASVQATWAAELEAREAAFEVAEDLDPDDPADPDALFVIRGRAVSYDEFYKYHFDPEPRQ